jgi:hypothetical protein
MTRNQTKCRRTGPSLPTVARHTREVGKVHDSLTEGLKAGFLCRGPLMVWDHGESRLVDRATTQSEIRGESGAEIVVFGERYLGQGLHDRALTCRLITTTLRI